MPAKLRQQRDRHIHTGPTAAQAELAGKLNALCAEFFMLNNQANEIAGKAKEARARLLRELDAAQMSSYEAHVTLESGAPAALVATVEAPKREVVDVKLLKQIVDDATFVACVTASKSSVKAAAGDGVVARVVTVTSGTRNVSVEQKKG